MSDAELVELARVRLLGRTVLAPLSWPLYMSYRGQVTEVRLDELTRSPVVVIQALDYPMTGTLLAEEAFG